SPAAGRDLRSAAAAGRRPGDDPRQRRAAGHRQPGRGGRPRGRHHCHAGQACAMTHFDPITLVVALALLSLVPLAAVMMTSFLKIAIVLSLVRNALGVQQVPPNMALYGLALILSAYVMAPVIMQAG